MGFSATCAAKALIATDWRVSEAVDLLLFRDMGADLEGAASQVPDPAEPPAAASASKEAVAAASAEAAAAASTRGLPLHDLPPPPSASLEVAGTAVSLPDNFAAPPAERASPRGPQKAVISTTPTWPKPVVGQYAAGYVVLACRDPAQLGHHWASWAELESRLEVPKGRLAGNLTRFGVHLRGCSWGEEAALHWRYRHGAVPLPWRG